MRWTAAARLLASSPSLRVHYFVAPKDEVAALAVDATHVYRLTLYGVFRRPK